MAIIGESPPTYPGTGDPSESWANTSSPKTASSATSWSVGINWWLNRNLRLLSSFTHTTFDGGGRINPVDPLSIVPPATVTHQDENALMTRMQLSF
jgi:phosphate-selective porin OprO/OprP